MGHGTYYIGNIRIRQHPAGVAWGAMKMENIGAKRARYQSFACWLDYWLACWLA